jgi:hypothetical protein
VDAVSPVASTKAVRWMGRSKLIRARDESATQVVILDVEDRPDTEVPPRYELAKVERISEIEFVVVQTGQVLRKLKS